MGDKSEDTFWNQFILERLKQESESLASAKLRRSLYQIFGAILVLKPWVALHRSVSYICHLDPYMSRRIAHPTDKKAFERRPH